MAWRSFRENGAYYGGPGLIVTAIGGIIVLREWWKRV
jgi:hypothetical protein